MASREETLDALDDVRYEINEAVEEVFEGRFPNYISLCWLTPGEGPEEEILSPEDLRDHLAAGLQELSSYFSNLCDRYETALSIYRDADEED